MNPLADLPTWVAILVALFAGGVLVALNLGWLMAAKSMLDAQRKKNAERAAGAASATPTTEPGRPARERGTSDRTPIV